MMDRSDVGLVELGRSIGKSLIRFLLGRDVNAALIRFIVLAGFLAMHWVVAIVGLRFPGEIPVFWLRTFPPFTYPLLNIASTFLNPEVLLHLVPVIAGLILGLLIATRYLSDLFELDQFEIAWRYLGGAIFGLSTPKLRVNHGDRDSLDPTNPIKRIGGPGMIETHLGYAAVFETIEGIPLIYGLSHTSEKGRTPSDPATKAAPRSRYTLGGFERLRDVVDLRDRITKVDEIHAETRDGVEVLAQDAQMVFRVFGGDQERSLQNPYPYTEEAIRRIVYAQPVLSTQRRSPTDALKYIVRQEIRQFVRRHTLEQFLALQPYRLLDVQKAPASEDEGPIASSQAIQIPRRELTERFHTNEVKQRLQEHGLELDWVGVGTWRISEFLEEDQAESTPHTLIRTWRDSQRLMLIRSPEYLQQQQLQAFQQRPHAILQAWIDTWEIGELPGAYRCFELLSTIAHQLEALEKKLDRTSDHYANLSLLRDHIDTLLQPNILGSDEP